MKKMSVIDHINQEKTARVVSIGNQSFSSIRENNNFYVDKTGFIKAWWESYDIVTLITRPRRFGKTLNMNMLECFFSNQYAGREDLFEGLSIWQEEKYQELQGTYPVIFLSFAGVKENNYLDAVQRIKFNIVDLYNKNHFLMEQDFLTEIEQEQFRSVNRNMSDVTAASAIHDLCGYLSRYYGKNVIVLLDEYDTPMQEAYVNGYWEEIVSFTRVLFNNTFKTNSCLERAVMTGITRISKESLFSDLNNLKVITMSSDKYASCFGFTETEVFAAMDEFCLDCKEEVKRWYDGFTIGAFHDLYNPWSIISFLDERKLKTYWANTSSNGLVSNLLQQGNKNIKMQFERLLQNHSIISEIDEEIVFNQLEGNNDNAVWSLLFASGYLTALQIEDDNYELVITNYEVEKMFYKMVRQWFRQDSANYNDFIKALLIGNLKEMNVYMNRLSLAMFSYFDGGTHPSETTEPERFYHGFVLGILSSLAGRYEVTSNRESGLGRYDVVLSPLNQEDDGIILEFKVHDWQEENTMEDTVQAALEQISEKRYEQILINRGIDKTHIRKYGFAFRGKEVLIGAEV